MIVKNRANSEVDLILGKYAALDMFAGYEIRTPTSPGPDGDTPFHMVAYDGDIEAAKTMLSYVDNINLAGDIGNSPLHYAVLNNKPEMAEFLISNGADVMLKNEYGDTPIDFMDGNEAFCKIRARLVQL